MPSRRRRAAALPPWSPRGGTRTGGGRPSRSERRREESREDGRGEGGGGELSIEKKKKKKSDLLEMGAGGGFFFRSLRPRSRFFLLAPSRLLDPFLLAGSTQSPLLLPEARIKTPKEDKQNDDNWALLPLSLALFSGFQEPRPLLSLLFLFHSLPPSLAAQRLSSPSNSLAGSAQPPLRPLRAKKNNPPKKEKKDR